MSPNGFMKVRTGGLRFPAANHEGAHLDAASISRESKKGGSGRRISL